MQKAERSEVASAFCLPPSDFPSKDREAKRARSGAEVTSKMESALQELEETGIG